MKASNFPSPCAALQPHGVRVTVVGSPAFVAISSRACWSFLPHFGHLGMAFDMFPSVVGGESLTIPRGDTRAKGFCYHPPARSVSAPRHRSAPSIPVRDRGLSGRRAIARPPWLVCDAVGPLASSWE